MGIHFSSFHLFKLEGKLLCQISSWRQRCFLKHHASSWLLPTNLASSHGGSSNLFRKQKLLNSGFFLRPKPHHSLHWLVLICPQGLCSPGVFPLSTWQPFKYVKMMIMDKWPLSSLSTKIFPVRDCESSYLLTFAIFCTNYSNLLFRLPITHSSPSIIDGLPFQV